MGERWNGNATTEPKSSLANHLLERLQLLHANPSLTTEFISRVSHDPPRSAPMKVNYDADDMSPRNSLFLRGSGKPTQNVMHFGEPTVMQSEQGPGDHLMSPSQAQGTDCRMSTASGGTDGTDELSGILNSFSDDHFMGMDRVISFDDLNYEGLYDVNSLALTREATQSAWSMDLCQWPGPDTQR